MVDGGLIRKALSKSCEYLLEHQEKDGSWAIEVAGPKYRLYQHPVVVASEAIQSLIFAISPKHTKNIQRGLQYCFNAELSKKEDIDLHAWRLAALNFSNAEVFLKEQKKTAEILVSLQTEEGCWQKFPEANVLTNFSVIEAIKPHLPEKSVFSKMRAWLAKGVADDGMGWGFGPNEEKSIPSFTSEGILILLNCGEDVLSERIQKAKGFLEASQKEDGSWVSPFNPSVDSPHQTSISALALMLTSENPFNERVEKAMDFILNCQTEEGYFTRPAVHHTYYTNLFLAFYLYLKEKLNSASSKHLLKAISSPQYFSVYCFDEFKKSLKRNLNTAALSSVLNSRVLGTTARAVRRRKDILRALNGEGAKTVAEIIDILKEKEEYAGLKKRSHLTQIKSDVEFLKDLKLLQERNRRFYSSIKII